MLELTTSNVETVFRACLRDEGPITEGVIHNAILDTTGHEQDIKDLLSQLHTQFRQNQGGGWSFLMACETSTGIHWGEHFDIEKLVLLGRAAGLLEFCLPREFWRELPGGMPYFMVLIDG